MCQAYFLTAIYGIAQRGELSWIIFDEIHKLLTDLTHRPIFACIPNLVAFECISRSGIPEWDIIRMSVFRPNCELDVQECPLKLAMHDAVFEHIQMPNGACILPEGKRFKTTAYHSGNRATNDQVLLVWRDGETLTIFTNTLLDSGNDYVQVRDCMNVGFLFTLLDWQQQCDRRACDGEASACAAFITTNLKLLHFNASDAGLDLGQAQFVE
ncbi:hypothetical protein DFH09DRAFT_1307878 [Mycena vulgaris]|nr:hypothetical protein DFH09DRAFT_1307878 [Mycena vulgaris]